LRVGITHAGDSSGTIPVHAHGLLVREIISSLFVVLCMVPVALFAGPALAEESGEDFATMSLDEISRKLENPLTKLWSLTVQENFSVDQGDQVDGTDVSNTLFFQPFLPIPLGEKWMFTARPVFPLVTNSTMSPGEDQRSAHKTGFGDIQMLSLIGPDSGGGIVYGVGVTMRFPSATDENLGQEKWQAAPAGMFFYMGRPWVTGLLVQHWESYAGDSGRDSVSQTDIQYVVRRGFGQGWSIGMGPTISVDWEANSGDKLTLPIGLGITKTIRIGKMPMKLRFEPQYSIVHPDDFGPVWNFRFQITSVIPNPFRRSD
jgi:hypothetical protein